MYIQITTRCNMSCRHCSFSCTAQGEDMNLETFRAALTLSEEYGEETICIGGGEPTIHPQFWEFMGLSLGHSEYVWLATNGKMTDTAIALCRMARRGVISCALSIDPYHDPIDNRVVSAFSAGLSHTGRGRNMHPSTKPQMYGRDLREVRDTSHNLANQGRARDNGIAHSDRCGCPELMVTPDGSVKACGCNDSPTFGNVSGIINIPEDWDICECHRAQESVVCASGYHSDCKEEG